MKIAFSFRNVLKIFMVFTIILLSGCKLTMALRAMKNTDVKPEYIAYQDKSIIFTPLVHFGQKEFYDSLKDSLVVWKSRGYTVFYEQIKSKAYQMEEDSLTVDIANRKWRKIVGGEQMTREGYEDLSEVFKGGVVQPEYEDLGLDETDLNADVTLPGLINSYENIYGEINLDSCDYATILDSAYSCSKALKGNLNPVIIDFRNEELVKTIIAADEKNIVVLYGKLHIKGLKKLLKEEEKKSQ